MKFKYDEPLLNFAFNFNLRPYIGGAAVYSAVFPAAMNVVMMARANRVLGPRVTMLYFVLQPIFTWVADYLLLRDAVYATQAAGPGSCCPPRHPTHFEPSLLS